MNINDDAYEVLIIMRDKNQLITFNKYLLTIISLVLELRLQR